MAREKVVTTTAQTLVADIAAGRFKPVYYFFGTEDYRMIEAEKFIATQFLPGTQRSTNYRRLDGRKTSVGDLVNELAAFPMLGEKQMVAVTDVQHYKPTDLQKIFKMFTPADPNRVIVLSTPSPRMPKKNSAFITTVKQVAEVVEFPKLSEPEMTGVITKRLAKAQLTISREALALMTRMIAGNRGALDNETDKLIAYAPSGATIDEAMVTKVCSGYEVYSVFDLADHIVAGNKQRVLTEVRQLFADGNGATGIVFWIARHFLALYLTKNNQPLPPQQAWLAPKYRQQAGKYSSGQLEQILLALADLDADLRRQPPSQTLAVEQVILQIMTQPAA